MLGLGWVVLLSGQKEHRCKCPRFRALHTGPQKGPRSPGGVNCAEPVKFTWKERGSRAFSTSIRRALRNGSQNQYLCSSGAFPRSPAVGHSGTANRMRSGELLRYDKVLGGTLD